MRNKLLCFLGLLMIFNCFLSVQCAIERGDAAEMIKNYQKKNLPKQFLPTEKESHLVQEEQQNQILIALGLLTVALQALTYAWPAIANFFGTHVTTSIVDLVVNKGFNYFEASGSSQEAVGVQPEYLSNFTSFLMTQLEVAAESQNSLKDYLLESMFVENASTWTSHHVLYNKENQSSGEASYAIVLWNRNQTTNLTNWVYATYNASFTLAPNFLILKTQKSSLGGIFNSDSYSYQAIPNGISLDDIEQVYSFFEYVGYKSIANLLNIKCNFPAIQNPRSALSDT